MKLNLREYTTLKIGGEARKFFSISTISDLKKTIKKWGPEFYLLGGGSNLLIKDSPIDKPVIKLGQNFKYIRNQGCLVEIGAATLLSSVLRFCSEKNLSGVENLAGIPATIGGLLKMNAGSFNDDISGPLESVDVMDLNGGVQRLKREEIDFSYRSSGVSNDIIVGAVFRMKEKAGVKDRINFFLNERWKKQPRLFTPKGRNKGLSEFAFEGRPNCGCIFKNPKSLSAGKIIEESGLKGLRKNDAQISLKHANFIVNLGKAAYADVDYLVGFIREKVYNKYGFILEEEIVRWT